MPSDTLILIGVNHKTTPVEKRERLALVNGYDEALMVLKNIPGLHECFLLSTCNRVELLFVCKDSNGVQEKVISFLFGSEVSQNELDRYLYILKGQKAVHHLFSVAASLDSMVIGETQILGQIKAAYRSAARLRCTGPLLNKLLHKSFSVAKRVRTETAIGSSAVSISYAAVQLAKKIFGNLQNKKVLIIGAGEMAELAAEHLVGQGIGEVIVANRTLSRAVDLARRFNGRAISIEELTSQLQFVDIVISSTGSLQIILSKEQVKPIMRARMNSPLFFIDIAVPRDLDPRLIELDNVYLYDIDDLSNIVETNKDVRDKEAVKALRIVDEEALKFQRWSQGASLSPTIQALKKKFEDIAGCELQRTFGRLQHLSEEDRRAFQRMTDAIVGKILHDPLIYLKSQSCSGRDTSDIKVAMVRDLFDLAKDDDQQTQ